MRHALNLKNVSISFLLVLAVCLSAWSILISHSWHTRTLNTDPNEADSFMQDVISTVLNKQGSPSLTLTTPKMTHYPADDTTQIIKPHVTVYRHSPNPWYIDSDFAKATHGIDEILFWSHVGIQHPEDQNNPTTLMQTESLTIFPNTQIASTDQAVIFIQPDTTIHAVGMLAHLDEGTIKLLSQAKGEYVPSTS